MPARENRGWAGLGWAGLGAHICLVATEDNFGLT